MRNFGDSDADIPTLVCLQELLRSGWSLGTEEPAMHDAFSVRCIRRALKVHSKYLLRCLINLDQLLASGLGGLLSGEKWEYYFLVLGSPEPRSVPVGLSSKAYRALMRGDPIGDHVAPEPVCDRARGESDSASSSVVMFTEGSVRRSVRSRRSRGSKETIEDIVFPMGRPTEAATAPKKGSSKASAEPAGVSPAGPSSSGPWKPPLPPSTEWGDQFVVDELVFKVDVWPLSPPPDGKRQYTRYKVSCPLASARPEHNKCHRSRSVGPAQCELGPWEPVAFLCLWAKQCGQCSGKSEHSRFVPKRSAIREYMLSKNWIPPV